MSSSPASTLLEKGYAITHLSPTTTTLLTTAHSLLPTLFTHLSSSTASSTSSTSSTSNPTRYRGYQRIPDTKHVLFLHPTSPSHSSPLLLGPDVFTLPSSTEPEAVEAAEAVETARSVLTELYAALEDETLAIFRAIWGELGEEGDGGEWVSDRSVHELSCFEYDPCGEDATPCEGHTDYTLLTLVPVSTLPALNVLDLKAFQVAEIEALAAESGPGAAIVMAGEALELISRSRIPAATHAVTPGFSSPRISTPFLLHVTPSALFTPSPSLSTPDPTPLPIGSLIDNIRASRTSIIYD